MEFINRTREETRTQAKSAQTFCPTNIRQDSEQIQNYGNNKASNNILAPRPVTLGEKYG
jgi:hypothetical protein